MPSKKIVIPMTALALTGAAALLVPNVLCADESAHDAVERLMPQLLSDDAATRAEAEKKLFELGDGGRTELERLTRDSDSRRAVTALRLLQSPKWKAARPAPGEVRVHGDDDARPDDQDESVDPLRDIDAWRAQMERRVEEMRRRFKELDGFDISGPGFQFKGGDTGSSSGSMVENDKKTTWRIDADGSVNVTIQDGKDAPEEKFEAKSMEELRKEHPAIAKRLDLVVPRENGRNFVFRFGGKDGQSLRDFRDDPFRFDVPRTQVLGVEWSPVPDVLRDQLDLPAGGMVVETVVNNTLAEKLGLARHDVIVEIQGRSVSGSPDVRVALEEAKAGDKITAVVVRKGKRQTLEATK
jgi:hypothetical protein